MQCKCNVVSLSLDVIRLITRHAQATNRNEAIECSLAHHAKVTACKERSQDRWFLFVIWSFAALLDTQSEGLIYYSSLTHRFWATSRLEKQQQTLENKFTGLSELEGKCARSTNKGSACWLRARISARQTFIFIHQVATKSKWFFF
jgi:hypothetical protein